MFLSLYVKSVIFFYYYYIYHALFYSLNLFFLITQNLLHFVLSPTLPQNFCSSMLVYCFIFLHQKGTKLTSCCFQLSKNMYIDIDRMQMAEQTY